MIEGFKSWINSMLCLGIFVLFIQLIIPKNNLKKYIYSLIGIITIITVITPISGIVKDKSVIEDCLNQVINNMSDTSVSSDFSESDLSKYQDLNNQTIKESVITKIESDIKTKLSEKEVSVKDVEVVLNSEYEIEKVEIKVDDSSNNSNISSYIVNEYGLSLDKIKVRGE